MNSLSVKTKFQTGQFKSLTQISCNFEGQFDLKVKVEVTDFEIVQDLYMIKTQLKFEGKISTLQK